MVYQMFRLKQTAVIKPAANSALSDAEDDRDTTRTKASEAQTAYNDANTAKNGIDDDSTLAQIESAISNS